MYLVLGGNGYVGSKFCNALEQRGLPYRAVSRSEVDYADRNTLAEFLKTTNATALINAAGYTGKPNVDACEWHKADCTMGNAVLPGIIQESCERVGIPWGHISSGCIYSGKRGDGTGFTEDDRPNFSFRANHCSFYSGTKALGEEILGNHPSCYVWRLRIPFNHEATDRNYLSKLMRYDRLLDAENSISHLDEFVDQCLNMIHREAPYGIYNMTNPGSVTAKEVVAMIEREREYRKENGLPCPFPEQFSFFESEEEFMKRAAQTPRSNCVLDTTKAADLGFGMRPVHEALKTTLRQYEPATQ